MAAEVGYGQLAGVQPSSDVDLAGIETIASPPPPVTVQRPEGIRQLLHVEVSDDLKKGGSSAQPFIGDGESIALAVLVSQSRAQAFLQRQSQDLVVGSVGRGHARKKAPEP